MSNLRGESKEVIANEIVISALHYKRAEELKVQMSRHEHVEQEKRYEC